MITAKKIRNHYSKKQSYLKRPITELFDDHFKNKPKVKPNLKNDDILQGMRKKTRYSKNNSSCVHNRIPDYNSTISYMSDICGYDSYYDTSQQFMNNNMRQKLQFVQNNWINNNKFKEKPLLIFGPPSSGKSRLVYHLFHDNIVDVVHTYYLQYENALAKFKKKWENMHVLQDTSTCLLFDSFECIAKEYQSTYSRPIFRNTNLVPVIFIVQSKYEYYKLAEKCLCIEMTPIPKNEIPDFLRKRNFRVLENQLYTGDIRQYCIQQHAEIFENTNEKMYQNNLDPLTCLKKLNLKRFDDNSSLESIADKVNNCVNVYNLMNIFHNNQIIVNPKIKYTSSNTIINFFESKKTLSKSNRNQLNQELLDIERCSRTLDEQSSIDIGFGQYSSFIFDENDRDIMQLYSYFGVHKNSMSSYYKLKQYKCKETFSYKNK